MTSAQISKWWASDKWWSIFSCRAVSWLIQVLASVMSPKQALSAETSFSHQNETSARFDKVLNMWLPRCDWIFYYILLIILLVLSQFFHVAPSTQQPLLCQSSHSYSCPWFMHISPLATPFPMLYFTSPWLFCNYLFGLFNPLLSSCSLSPTSHLATISTLSVAMMLSLFFLFT